MMSAATASGLDIAEQKQAYSETDLESAMRKNTWRLLPVLVIAYFFNYIDRTSVGFAAMQMNKDIRLTATQFGWGAGIMFFSYCLLEVPSNLAMYRLGARKWIARIMITWGLAAAATALLLAPSASMSFVFFLECSRLGFSRASSGTCPFGILRTIAPRHSPGSWLQPLSRRWSVA